MLQKKEFALACGKTKLWPVGYVCVLQAAMPETDSFLSAWNFLSSLFPFLHTK